MELGDRQGAYPRQTPSSPYNTVLSSSPVPLSSSQVGPETVAFGINATTPPPADPQTTMQRADEINTI